MIEGNERGNRSLYARLMLFGCLFLAIFLVLIGHLFNLQIIEKLEWEGRAQAVSRRSEPLLAQRGFIWDRNFDIPLAVNIDSFAVDIVPAEFQPENPEELAKKLANKLDMDSNGILSALPTNWKNYWNPIEIAGGIPYSTIVEIAESVEEYPGISWQSKPYRWYNDVGSMSHILGYVGNITIEELQILYNEGYANTSSLGKSGIEKAFDGILRGKDGQRFWTVDVKGRYLESDRENIIPPENGFDVVLTIDRSIQALAEKALGPRKGAVVVLKPGTGEILAMVSYPSFDPNLFMKPGPGSFASLSLNTDFPFLNRVIQSGYAPASTFKLVMSAALLGEQAFDPDKRIQCQGSMTLGNREFWCHRRSGHGYLNLQEALAESCNIYFGTIGVKYLGIDTISRYARAFGLGSVTGIELDGENSGIVPDADWKKSIYHSIWTLGDTLNASVGQGFLLVTPLQMANVVAGIANKGVIYRPYILKEVRRSGTGVVLEHTEPEVLRTVDLLNERNFDYLQWAMRSVVTEGTGKFAIYTKSADVAGKTGTGEIGFDDRWHDWFVAFGPYRAKDPADRIVVVVMVEAADSYDWWAPKATDIIFEGIFGQKGYEDVIKEWQERRIWWSRDLPSPGSPHGEALE